jgi:hypothetical protein
MNGTCRKCGHVAAVDDSQEWQFIKHLDVEHPRIYFVGGLPPAERKQIVNQAYRWTRPVPEVEQRSLFEHSAE